MKQGSSTARDIDDRSEGSMWQGAHTMYLVKRLEMRLRSLMEPVVKSAGLTVPQYTALTILEARPGTSSAELARSTFVSAQAANQLIDGLHARGLVRRDPSPHHGKILSLRLTRDGEQVLGTCAESIAGIEVRMLGALEKTMARDFHDSLRACITVLGE